MVIYNQVFVIVSIRHISVPKQTLVYSLSFFFRKSGKRLDLTLSTGGKAIHGGLKITLLTEFLDVGCYEVIKREGILFQTGVFS